jgi:hypothetical protein
VVNEPASGSVTDDGPFFIRPHELKRSASSTSRPWKRRCGSLPRRGRSVSKDLKSGPDWYAQCQSPKRCHLWDDEAADGLSFVGQLSEQFELAFGVVGEERLVGFDLKDEVSSGMWPLSECLQAIFSGVGKSA